MFALTDQLHVDATMWALFVSTLLPPITGYLTKLSTPTNIKALITLGLNLLNVVIATVVTVGGDAVISKQSVITAVIAFLVSSKVHSVIWKPAGITSSDVVVPDVTHPGQVIHLPGKLAFVGVVDPGMKAAA